MVISNVKLIDYISPQIMLFYYIFSTLITLLKCIYAFYKCCVYHHVCVILLIIHSKWFHLPIYHSLVFFAEFLIKFIFIIVYLICEVVEKGGNFVDCFIFNLMLRYVYCAAHWNLNR